MAERRRSSRETTAMEVVSSIESCHGDVAVEQRNSISC